MSCPAALPAIALFAGVGAGALQPALTGPAFALMLALWPVAGWLVRQGDARRFAAIAALTLAAAGCALAGDAAASAVRPSIRDWYDRLPGTPGEPVLLEGRLSQDARPTDFGATLILEATAVTYDGDRRDVGGGVRLSVSGMLAAERLLEWRGGRLVQMPARVRRPTRHLNPGVRDEELAVARRGIVLVGSVKSGALVDVVAGGHPGTEAAAAVRGFVRRAIGAAVGRWSERSAGIITAILIGDRAGLEPGVTERLQAAGTYHVIAISGGNIAILAGLLLGILRVCRPSARVAAVVTILSLIGYASVVGDDASVVRATVVAVIYLAARLWDHRTPPLNTLAAAGSLILVVAPLAIFDAGFLLSFGATLGILIGASRIQRALAGGAPASPPGQPPVRSRSLARRLAGALAALFAATLCAELALFPIAAAVFSRVTFAGFALNFVAIPLMTLAQIAGLAALGLSALHATAALPAGWVAHVSAQGLVDSARLVDLAPWLAFRVPAPGWIPLGGYYAGWAVWLGWRRHPVARRTAPVPIVLCAAVMLAAPLPPPGRLAARLFDTAGAALTGAARPPGRLAVTFLDVGQADATLVEFPDGRSLLVDAGGVPLGSFDVGGRIVAPALWHRGLRRLDYLALTHGHPDHIGGAPAILRDFRPREIWEGVPVPAFAPLQELEGLAQARGAAWRRLQRGDLLRVAGVEVRVWHPPPPDWERQSVRNDDSIVLELTYGAVSIVLPGDAGWEVERELSRLVPPAGLRVLKMGHHGSASSTTAAFLEALRPAAAIVSAGRDNFFGHPAPAVLDRLEEAGVEVLRTDYDGAITLETDGRVVAVKTFTGRRLRFAQE